MKEKNKKGNYLFISDLDGTLLNKNHELEPEAVKSLNDMMKKGLKFTYITSRDHRSSREIMKHIEFTLPVAICGGAAIVDFRTGRIIRDWNINYEVVRIVISFLQLYNFEVSLVTNEKGKVNHYKIAGSSDIVKIDKLKSERIISIAFKDTPERIKNVYESFMKQNGKMMKASVFQDADNTSGAIIEIISSHASKGLAAEKIVNMYQELKEHRVVAFGNDMNDFDLLKYAKIGVGVGNLPKELQRYADIQLEYSQGLSVIKLIENYFYER